MRQINVRAIEGPNIWSKQPVLEVIREQVEIPVESIRTAWQRLQQWWAAAGSRLRPSEVPSIPWPAAPENEFEILLALTLNLQRRMGLPVRDGFLMQTERVSGDRRIVIEIVDATVGLRAWELASNLWDAALHQRPFDFNSRLAEFSSLAFQICLGTTTSAIVRAARAQGIPALRLDNESLVQLGYGVRQRRLQTAITDRSGHIAESVSRDKMLTKQLLQRVGIPVPNGRSVDDADDALAAALEIGLPVVVKPRDADYGNGVSLKLRSPEEIAAAYLSARTFSDHVIVERFLEGAHHRVTVVGDKVVGAVRREPVVIVGDGRQSVSELIDEMNRDPRRGAEDDLSLPWMWIETDDEIKRVLASQGHRLDSIPALRETVILRLDPCICWGGGVIDVTDDLHPDIAAVVVDAVSMIGLDIAGVDLIATDISRPLAEQHGGLLEVNAGPAIFLHLSPVCQPPRPVPEAIIELMFPEPDQSRIPVIGICGDDDNGSVTKRVIDLLRTTYAVVGAASRFGIVVGTRQISNEPGDHLAGGRIVLQHPRVEAAVCQVSLEGIRYEGLAFDQSKVAVVLSMTAGSSGLPLSDRDRCAALKVLIDSTLARGTTIFNVDDPVVAESAGHRGPGTIAISVRADHPTLNRIRRQGGRAVFLHENAIILANGSNEIPLYLNSLFMASPAFSTMTKTSLLATLATGWALSIAPELLRRELPRAA